MNTVARNLVVVLGDQLDLQASALDGFDRERDRVWMSEVAGEATHVWSHKARIALFLSGMRHFRDDLEAAGFPIEYIRLEPGAPTRALDDALLLSVRRWKPAGLVVTEPGEYRVEAALKKAAAGAGVPLEIRPDGHFLCSRREFAEHARGRRQLRMEFFYREMRRKHGILMDGDQPAGGQWNFDVENRERFGSKGPGRLPRPPSFPPDRLTRQVLNLVESAFPGHPGTLEHFDWPVTRGDALAALRDFVSHRLTRYGTYQDAMWTDEPFLYHSLLSVALNLKLLNPREVMRAAEEAHRKDPGKFPLSAVEGFIRQILGWREYVRGVYWLHMPGYLKRNHLEAREPLPAFYWSGKTEMTCLREAIGQTLEYGYAHHIQRLMVTGLFALLLGVDPRRVHEWYLAAYVDAVEWVELPNTLGMSQYADGGIMGSKPYAATGKYIQRMSNYCRNCPFDPALSTGDKACPFTTLYWDFLMRHEKVLRGNNRMKLQVRNLDRISSAEKKRIRTQAGKLRRARAA